MVLMEESMMAAPLVEYCSMPSTYSCPANGRLDYQSALGRKDYARFSCSAFFYLWSFSLVLTTPPKRTGIFPRWTG